MDPGRALCLLVAIAAAACSDANDAAVGDAEDGGATPSAPNDAAAIETFDAAPDAPNAPNATDASHDAAHEDAHHDAAPVEAGPTCKKELTVVFSVGTGAGAVASLSNGCWTVIDADGAANPSYRKCSTSSFVVKNASAPNYAYDDTNPSRPLSDDQNFLAQCASGATGVGFEYMAYRGGWRLLTATHMAAYFAELYSTDQTIDDYEPYWQASISGHTVYPMINIGPNDATTIETAAARVCGKVSSHGYFGVYNGDWANGMSASDARAKALAKALNACTG